MWNKIILHVFAALFSGFTFWKMGDGTFALQLRLFASKDPISRGP